MTTIIHLTPPIEWLPTYVRPETVWVGPLGELARVELDGGVTLLRSGECGRPVELLSRAA
jgi:hypothetical protein